MYYMIPSLTNSTNKSKRNNNKSKTRSRNNNKVKPVVEVIIEKNLG